MIRPSVASTAVGLVPIDEQAHRLGAAHDRAVAFHGHDAVDDGDGLGQRGVDVEDRLRNAGVVQHVFRPAVLDAGNHAVQILQRAGVADPVMGLHLGHRDDQVGLDDLLRKIEAGAACWRVRRS